MVNRDQVPILIGIGAVIVTLSAGTCSTNARIADGFDNVNRRIDDVNRRMDDGFENVDRRMDDGFANVNRRVDDGNKRIDGLQIELRELRTLFVASIESRTTPAPAD